MDESHYSTTAFQAVLYANFCLSFLFNSYAVYLIACKTPKQMNNYRRYLLNIQFCAFWLDLSLSLVFQLYFAASHQAFCIVGPAKHLSSSPWLAILATYAILILSCICSFSLLYALIYRFATIFDLETHMDRPAATVLLLLIQFVSPPLIAIPFYPYAVAAIPLQTHIWNGTYQAFPEIRDLLDQNVCFFMPQELAHTIENAMYSDFALLCGAILLGASMVIACFVHLFRKRAKLSAQTYRMHLQFNLAMGAQLALPFFTLALPVSTVFVCTILHVNCPRIVDKFVTLSSLHSSLNAILMIICIYHYRRATAELISVIMKKAVRLFTKQAVTEVVILNEKQ